MSVEFTPGKQLSMNEIVQENYRQSEGIIPYQDFVSNLFAPPPQMDVNTYDTIMGLCHIALGIAGEYIEFRNELEAHALLKSNSQSPQECIKNAYLKAQKELGDLCYYIYMAANFENISLPSVNPLFNTDSPRAIELYIDIIKRKIFYKLDVDLSTYIYDAWGQINFLANSIFNLPIEFFILQNKEKLMKRFPEGIFRKEDVIVKKDEEQSDPR